MKILLCMVLALAVATAAIAGPCGALTYSTNGKSADIYNLDALTNMGALTATTTYRDPNNNSNTTFTFQVAICGQLSLPNGCPNSNEPSQSACFNAATNQNNAAVCSTFPLVVHPAPAATPVAAPPASAYGTNCFGQYLTAGSNAFTTQPMPGGGVTLKYIAGDQEFAGQAAFSSIISITCNRQVTGQPHVTVTWNPGMTTALFNLGHVSGCPRIVQNHHKLSGGSVCLIILAVVVPLYILAGVLYNHFVKGRSGTAMLPNHTFWSKLPGLCADGVRFLLCRPIVGDRENYERVGE